MAERRIISDDSVPAIPRHVKLRFNEQRQQWVVQAPERILMPDDTAVEILHMCDGTASVGMIVERLAGKYNAPREAIGKDVAEMLQGLADKGFIVA